MITDVVIAQSSNVVNQMLSKQLGQIAQLYQQAVGVVKKKTPPPQMPPDVQASIQIAQMENTRKTEIDKATMGLKQQAAAAEEQRKQAESSVSAAQQRFEQMLAVNESRTAEMKDRLDQQIQLIKNENDNRQHQITEILKNNQDNQTNIIIERLKQEGLVASQSAARADTTDIADTMRPLLEAVQTQLNGQLESYGKRLDEHGAKIEAMHGIVSAPKRKRGE